MRENTKNYLIDEDDETTSNKSTEESVKETNPEQLPDKEFE